MTDIVAVLVVPAPNDPGGLLAAGACGPIPAMVSDYGGRGAAPEWHVTSIVWAAHVMLPLWWNGALCPEGWAQAHYALEPDAPSEEWHDGPMMLLWPSLRDVIRVAEMMVTHGLASRVIRLARVDGRLVEVEPVGVGR